MVFSQKGTLYRDWSMNSLTTILQSIALQHEESPLDKYVKSYLRDKNA